VVVVEEVDNLKMCSSIGMLEALKPRSKTLVHIYLLHNIRLSCNLHRKYIEGYWSSFVK
jgi:hypothetical protein